MPFMYVKRLGSDYAQKCKAVKAMCRSIKKANSILGMIRRKIVTRDKDTILRLNKTLVRPQLECCIQVWSPCLKQDMEKLEKVQRRDTKMIQCYKYLSYEERLIRCGLTTRRKGGAEET